MVSEVETPAAADQISTYLTYLQILGTTTTATALTPGTGLLISAWLVMPTTETDSELGRLLFALA